jgi:V/A-type H+/Na+-transporting ATPase subunit K
MDMDTDKMRILFKIISKLFLMTGILFFLTDVSFAANEVQGTASGAIVESNRWLAFAAMGAVGLSCIASAYALAKIGSAAMGAMSEKPEIGGRALIFLGMAEGIAIYGLIIAIMLVNKI